MNPETVLVQAWLKAGNQNADAIGCAGDALLRALVSRQLPEQEARRLTLHLAACAGCRRAVAQLVAGRAMPIPTAVSLPDLLSRGEITDAWRSWVRGLVSTLPPDEEESGVTLVAEYDELSPLRIDDLGRLIVDLATTRADSPSGRVRLSLASEGVTVDLCEVSLRSGRLYAVIDLSAFHPRPGIVRPGVVTAEHITVSAGTLAVLPLLARIQDDELKGTEFWDRLMPLAAHGEQLAGILAHEITSMESDQTTRAPRLRTGATGPASATPDKTPAGRVQYALSELVEFAAVWKECNGTELPGAAHCAAQLRGAISPVREQDAEKAVLPETRPSPTEQVSQAAPRIEDANRQILRQ